MGGPRILDNVGAVIIGRNEGDRLIQCLSSLSTSINEIVYVDSGSTDDSVTRAKLMGVHTVTLDMEIPFTAARARNAGAEYLLKHFSKLRYIQFVDGDCEMSIGWHEAAYFFLEAAPNYAIACGRRRERFPEQSVFNALCDIEWNTSIGDALSCGGDALIRAESYSAISGYNEALIAGEEPEMCYRLRNLGLKIMRLDKEMTSHDAAIFRIGQWWKRAKRAGYAFANNCYLHGRDGPEHFKCREVGSIVIWSLLFPISVLILGIFKPILLSSLFVYFIQIGRVVFQAKRRGVKSRLALYYGLSTIVAKWPQLVGVITFLLNNVKGRRGRLIEYK
jgi:glycosyltransferase involved in cell wall biosynthesis